MSSLHSRHLFFRFFSKVSDLENRYMSYHIVDKDICHVAKCGICKYCEVWKEVDTVGYCEDCKYDLMSDDGYNSETTVDFAALDSDSEPGRVLVGDLFRDDGSLNPVGVARYRAEVEDGWAATLRHVVEVTNEDSDVEEVFTAPNKRCRGVVVYCTDCLGSTINDCLCIEIIDLTK